MKKPKPKKFLYERMARFTWDSRFVVRVWIKAASWSELRSLSTVDLIAAYLARSFPPEGPALAADQLARMFSHRISAVEVVAANGHGLVVYTEWP